MFVPCYVRWKWMCPTVAKLFWYSSHQKTLSWARKLGHLQEQGSNSFSWRARKKKPKRAALFIPGWKSKDLSKMTKMCWLNRVGVKSEKKEKKKKRKRDFSRMERNLNTSWLTTGRRGWDVKSSGGMSEILLEQENKAEPMVGWRPGGLKDTPTAWASWRWTRRQRLQMDRFLETGSWAGLDLWVAFFTSYFINLGLTTNVNMLEFQPPPDQEDNRPIHPLIYGWKRSSRVFPVASKW